MAGLSVMRMAISETTPGTIAERQQNTPVDVANRWAMQIKRVLAMVGLGAGPAAAPAADAYAIFSANWGLSMRQELATVPLISETGCIAAGEMVGAERSQVGDSGCSLGFYGEPFPIFDFGEGIMVADRTLSLYIDSTNTANASHIRVMILYKLIKVTIEQYMAALTVMETL